VSSAAPTPAVPPSSASGSSAPRPTSDTPSIVLAWVLAGVSLVLLVPNVAGGAGFPSNAPVEQLMVIGVSLDLVAGAILLGVRAAIITRRPRGVFEGRAGIGRSAIAAGVLAAACLVGFVLLSIAPALVNASEGADQRYMSWSAGLFFLGAAWVLGLFFSSVAFRPSRGTGNNALALASAVVLLLVAAGTVAAAVAYGLGLTE